MTEPPIDRYCKSCMSNRLKKDGDHLVCRDCGNRWIPEKKTETEQKRNEDMRNKLDGSKIKELIEAGKSIPEVVAATGSNQGSVGNYLRRKGIKPKVDGRSLRYKKTGNESTASNHTVKAYPARTIDPERIKPRKYTRKLSPDKIIAAKVHAGALTIKHNGGNPDTAVVVSLIDAQIAEYNQRIDKLTQARRILA